MKAKIKAKHLVISLCALIVTICSIYFLKSPQQERLSQTEISELRDEYPICGVEVPPNISMRTLSLEEVKQHVDTFVYGEVVGDIHTYDKKISTGYSELDEKEKSKGLSNIYHFYEYTITVIDDTEGKYSKGEKITIADNTDFISYNPQLKDGMKIVVPVQKDEKVDGRHGYFVQGMYYVTDEGYAISAYDESASKVTRSLSGVKVSQLLKQLKK